MYREQIRGKEISSAYELTCMEKLKDNYGLNETVSKEIVLYSEKVNNGMMGMWFLNRVADHLTDLNVTDVGKVRIALDSFHYNHVLPFGRLEDEDIDTEVLSELDIEDAKFYLDWSTRFLVRMRGYLICIRKKNDDTVVMFNLMKDSCESLNIDIFEWCKATKIPYWDGHEDIEGFFTGTEENNTFGQPMLRYGSFHELIIHKMQTVEK